MDDPAGSWVGALIEHSQLSPHLLQEQMGLAVRQMVGVQLDGGPLGELGAL